MNIFDNIKFIHKSIPMAISIGTFDGVHIAHQKILHQLITEAQTIKGQSLVISFYQHPRTIIYPNTNIDLLTSTEEKNALFLKHRIDNILYLNFNEQLANLSYKDFFLYLQNHINIKSIIMGYNHNFGKNKEGNIDNLSQISNNIKIIKIKQQNSINEAISSSSIRHKLLNGNIREANQMLGRAYSLDVALTSSTNNPQFEPIDKNKIVPQGKDKYYILINGQEASAQIKENQIFVTTPFNKANHSNTTFIS